MNLWAKRIGQLSALAVALFFLSCEDETRLLGYKNPTSKFQVNYVEIPIESSVLLLDSQRTSNFLFTNETNRFLIGQYVDDQFGSVSTAAYTQYFTNSGTKLPANAIYDSVTLQLTFDFYNYGSKLATTSQSISVYEVDEELKRENIRNYFNKSEVQVNPTPLGSKTFSINPTAFEEYLTNQQDTNTENDTVLTMKIPLDPLFGQKIFESAIKYRDATTVADSAFVFLAEFPKIFKGLAIKSDVGDKIIGFNPLSSTAIIVHYHTAELNNQTFHLGLANVIGFSQIIGDRSATALAGLNQYAQDFYPDDDLRYVQSGTGIFTKLDFGKFFEFADTVPNLVINSAHLTLASIGESTFPAPESFALRILTPANSVNKYSSFSSQDLLDLSFYNPQNYTSYAGSVGIDVGSVAESDSALYVLGDQSDHLSYSSTTRSYDGNYSLFFQQLSVKAENKTRFQYFVLYPSSPARPSGAKTVNRAIFPKSGIKLKIYYTKPTAPLN